jgi:TIR domain
MNYENGLSILKSYAEDKDWFLTFILFESRLQENLYREKLYGSTEQIRADRAQIVDQLNQLAWEHLGKSFNDLCANSTDELESSSTPITKSAMATNAHDNSTGTGFLATPPQKIVSQPDHSQVFIGYSNKDKKYLEEFHSHLAYYIRTGKFDFWDNTKIQPGANWREEIGKALDMAQVAVLLVSADFIASDFIANNELPVLLAAAAHKGTIIYSVILRPCVFNDTELAQFHPINDVANPLSTMSKGKRDAVWTKIAESIRDRFQADS